jgi:hypothetical protein
MFRRSVNPVLARASVVALMNALNGTIGLAEVLDGAELRLFTNAITPSKDSVFADFAEPTFTGYAPVTPLTWSAVGNAGTDGLYNDTEVNITCTATPTPAETVEGYFLCAAGGGAFLFGERFEDPVGIAAIGDQLSLQIVAQLNFQLPVSA